MSGENLDPFIESVAGELKAALKSGVVADSDIRDMLAGDEVAVDERVPPYTPAELIDFFYQIDQIVLDAGSTLDAVFHTLSERLKKLFKAKYVEFLLIRGDELEYAYVTVPEWLSRITHRLTGISAIVGLRIPLFEGSTFKEFIDGMRPRELIDYEERLRSFRDFLAPDSPENVKKRTRLAPALMTLFGYDYVFQIPLIINGKVFGYFSFLQKGRYSERVRADIIMLSGKIANLVSIKKNNEELIGICASVAQGTMMLNAAPDKDGVRFTVDKINGAFISLFATDERRLLGKKLDEITPEIFGAALEYVETVYRTGKPEVLDIPFIKGDISVRVSLSRTENDRILVLFEDISEKIKMSNFDRLTDVYNRYTFLNLFSVELTRAERENMILAVFFLDLNKFKPVNDTYGHAVGDALLRKTADAIKASVRKTDIVGRFGGDEFIVAALVKETTDASTIAEKISSNIAGVSLQEGADVIHGSASIGIALRERGSAKTAAELISQGDEAMYRAKKEGLKYAIHHDR